jgi:hypothetical protein
MELIFKKRRISRIGAAIIAACSLLLLLAACVGSFEKRHADEFVGCNRNFRVAGGPAEACSEPGEKPLGRHEPGEILVIDYYYTDKRGEVWGRVEGGGWVRMEGLELVYDNTAFCEQHSEEITDASDPPPEGPRYIWSYPRSGEIIAIDSSSEEEGIAVFSSYTDEEGLVWIYLSTPGSSGWVCLDAPYDENIPAHDYGLAEIHYIQPPKKPGYWDSAPSYAPYAWGVIVLVVLVEIALQVRAQVRKNRR